MTATQKKIKQINLKNIWIGKSRKMMRVSSSEEYTSESGNPGVLWKCFQSEEWKWH